MFSVRLSASWSRVWIYCILPHIIAYCALWHIITMDHMVTCETSASLHDDVPPPKFLPSAVNVTVPEGDTAILPCAVRNLGTKQVSWRRADDDDFLTIGSMTWVGDEKIAVDHTTKANDITIWDLVIDKVGPAHAGVYECQVSSNLGHSKRVRLNVIGPPIQEAGQGVLPQATEGLPLFTNPVTRCGLTSPHGCIISMTGKRYVDLGESIHLVCNVTGGPRVPEDIDWFKDGDLIDPYKHQRMQIIKDQSIRDRAFVSELLISRATLRDAGEYVCRSSRHNIVSTKITVLRANSDNKRRGTGSVPDEYSTSDSTGLACLALNVPVGTVLLASWRMLS